MTLLSVAAAETEPADVLRRESASFRIFAAAVKANWRFGDLVLAGPRGAVQRVVGMERGVEARLEVNSERFVRRVLARGDIGFADSFVAGEWDTPDLAACLVAFAANFDTLTGVMTGHPLLRLAQAVSHRLNQNTRAGSRRNIHAHYDLGDDFYRLWLDAGMNYSSVLGFEPGMSLESAQGEKHAALARRMDLKRGQSVLEIGCGWGGFAEFAAKEYGADVTAVTISPSQRDYLSRRIQALGLGDQVRVELKDYRDLKGQFDRVASIEMFEAVGERYWPTFFATLRERLAPGGRAGLQVITIDEALFDGYRRRPDFIQLHVFPGGMLPSKQRLRSEAEKAGLSWAGASGFGAGYAATLREWARRFVAQTDAVEALGFDTRFQRLWRYYLAYCEAGFRAGRTDVIQVALRRD